MEMKGSYSVREMEGSSKLCQSEPPEPNKTDGESKTQQHNVKPHDDKIQQQLQQANKIDGELQYGTI